MGYFPSSVLTLWPVFGTTINIPVWRCVLQIIITGGNLEDSKEALKLARTNGKHFSYQN